MKRVVAVVNGWEIVYNENSIAPYQIRYGKRFDQVNCYRTLKGAENWAEKH